MSKHFEGPWDLGKSIQQYFLSEGGLTTHKANLITREHGLDKECGLGERIIDTGLHAETEGFEFQDVKEIDIKSVIKSKFSCWKKHQNMIKSLHKSWKTVVRASQQWFPDWWTIHFKMAAFPKAWKIV